jgi:hypothetical protein
MATTASFKQQCPSCEAMVPIRDPNLIGRKIDCPKCKYRFVVEDPGETEEAEDDGASKAKKGKRDEDKGGKGAKGKTAAKRRDDDDDEEAVGAGKKGGNTKLALIVGISVVVLAGLGVGGYFIIWGDSGSTTATRPSGPPSSGPSAQQKPPTTPANTEQAADAGTKPEETKPQTATEAALAASQPTGDFITNLLPNTTEGVCTVHVEQLKATALGREIFDPTAYNAPALGQHLGFPADKIDLLVSAWSFRGNWTLNILHVKEPLNRDAIRAALHAEPVAEKDQINGQVYYVLKSNPWLEKLGRSMYSFLVQTSETVLPPRSGPMALALFDAQTVVLGDVAPLQEFLKVGGRFQVITEEKKEEPKAEENKDQANQSPAGGGAGTIQRPGLPNAGAAGGGAGGMMQGQQQMQERMRQGMGGGRGGPGPAGAGQGGADSAAAEPTEPTATGNYLTISRSLKYVLDRLEIKKPVISLALDTAATRNDPARPLGLNPLQLELFFKEAQVIGAALLMKDNDITLRLASLFENEDDARRRDRQMRGDDGKDLAERLSKFVDTKVAPPEEEDAQVSSAPGRGGRGAGGRGPATDEGGDAMGGGGMARGGGGSGGAGAANMMAQQQMMQQRMRGQMGAGAANPMMQMMGQQNQQQNTAPPVEKPKSEVQVTTQERLLVFLTLHFGDPAEGRVRRNFVHQEVMKQKGYLDMASGDARIHEFARAIASFPQSNGGFLPRGTLERPVLSTRAGRPYSPDERLSWMVSLLPYLGPEQASLYGQIDRTKSWRDPGTSVDPGNLSLSSTLVPQFLDPEYPSSTWWVRYPGTSMDSAATHVVGIAGVGLDAADYSDLDATMTKRLGVFGYDRAMKLKDITDKPADTILAAEVSPLYKRPWMAGGGATVMGVPEKNSVQPFVADHGGKRGTLVVMVDGSVRFISENVSDDVFKGLATARGGENIVLTTRDAPILPPPDGMEMRTAPLPVPRPAARPPMAVSRSSSTSDDQTSRRQSSSGSGGSNQQAVLALQNNCANCHQTGKRVSGRFTIFNEDGSLNPRASKQKMLEQIASGKMPKRGQLSAADKSVLEKWLEGGN